MAETKYQRQKNVFCARVRVQTSDLRKINKNAFTLFDFLDACFSFSPSSKKQAAVVLQELKKGPVTFVQLLSRTNASKSSLFLLLEALKKSGLVEVRGGGGAFSLSGGFSEAVSSYALWWSGWKERF